MRNVVSILPYSLRAPIIPRKVAKDSIGIR
jgi:hypothetical protein